LFNKIYIIHSKDLIGPYKTIQNPEIYSKPKSYAIKHTKPQTGNLSVAVAREKKLSVGRKMKSKRTRKDKGRKEEGERQQERAEK
jgi:hypothetical protein